MEQNSVAWLNGANDNTITYTLKGKSLVIPGALVFERSDAKKETHFTPERVKELLASGSLTITEIKGDYPYKMVLKKGDFKAGASWEAIG